MESLKEISAFDKLTLEEMQALEAHVKRQYQLGKQAGPVLNIRKFSIPKLPRLKTIARLIIGLTPISAWVGFGFFLKYTTPISETMTFAEDVWTMCLILYATANFFISVFMLITILHSMGDIFKGLFSAVRWAYNGTIDDTSNNIEKWLEKTFGESS